MTQEDFLRSLTNSLNADVALEPEPFVAQKEENEEFEEQQRIAQRRQAEDRERQYQRSLQAVRDGLGRVASPIERKRIESFYSLEQKKAILDNHTVEKRYGMDGFKKMRIDFMDDGDSGFLVDENGKDIVTRENIHSFIEVNEENFGEISQTTLGKIRPVTIKIVPDHLYVLADADQKFSWIVLGDGND